MEILAFIDLMSVGCFNNDRSVRLMENPFTLVWLNEGCFAVLLLSLFFCFCMHPCISRIRAKSCLDTMFILNIGIS